MGDLITAAHVFEDPYQNLASGFPRFRSPDGDLFAGPLFQVFIVWHKRWQMIEFSFQ
jgi:hypothetical protein